MTSRTFWTDEPQAIPLEDIRPHPGFQYRAAGTDPRHVRKLQRTLENGRSLPPVKVARIGKALYLVDGFHRLQAYQAAKRTHVHAIVSRMSLPEAQQEAQLANTQHGKGLSRNDKAAIFQAFVAGGQHLNEVGQVKSSRVIADELNQMYSHETIRTKLRQLGVELNEGVEFPGGYKARQVDDEGLLAVERREEAEGCLESFEGLWFSLDDDDRRDLLERAKALVGALGRGERTEKPVAVQEEPTCPLDI